MMLMNKSAHERGEAAVRQPHEWSAAAVDFLSSTTTSTPDALLEACSPDPQYGYTLTCSQHDFMQQEWKLKELELHVLLVQRSAYMG